MLSIYTPLVLAVFVVWVYFYLNRVCSFMMDGGAYLSFLFDNPEKLNTPELMDVLITRDIPAVQTFLDQRNKLWSILVVGFIVNITIYIYYPYDTLLYPWMGYILTVAWYAANFEVFRVFVHLRRNKRATDAMCTAYYKLEQEQENLKNQIGLMKVSFEDLVEKITAALEDEEDTDGKNEK